MKRHRIEINHGHALFNTFTGNVNTSGDGYQVRLILDDLTLRNYSYATRETAIARAISLCKEFQESQYLITELVHI